MIVENAPAKVNLALHVTGQRPDGYHLLDSLVVFADICDRLQFELSDRLKLTVKGPLSAGVPTGPENLILKAAALFGTDLGAHIQLDKHLPHAAGIGGGSADAAAALRGLSRLWNLPLPKANALLSLGADVPVCAKACASRMQGIGDALTDVPALPPIHAVLVNPRVPVPTGPVFASLVTKSNAAMETPHWTDFASFIQWLSRQRNDLEAPARILAPEVSDVLSALKAQGAALSRMSGSGATCFGLFESQKGAQTAAEAIAALYPGWWTQDAAILP